MTTPSQPQNQALHDAVKAFAESAWEVLRTRGLLRCLELPEYKWTAGGPGSFVLEPGIRRLPEFAIPDEVKALPENGEIVRILAADEVVRSQEGKLIYHGGWSSQFGLLSDQALILLEWLITRPDGLTAHGFEEAYLVWEKDLLADSDDATVVYPLSSFACGGGPLELAGDLSLRPMTDDEIATCLAFGVLEPSIGSNRMASVERTRWCVAGKRHTRRVAFDAADFRGDVEAHQAFFQDSGRLHAMAEDFVTVLRLARPGDVRLAGQIRLYPGSRRTPYDEPAMTWGRNPGAGLGGSCYELMDSDRATVMDLWLAIRSPLVQNEGSLQTALRRLGYSWDRSLAQDRIIDLMIAAEAWFVAVGHDELRYRLALNGAYWMRDTRPKHRTFTFLRHAYDVRSSIVHGSAPYARDMVAETKEQLDEEAFVEALRSFMRDSLRLAVERVAAGQWSGWDSLLLGEEASTASGAGSTATAPGP